MPAAIGPPRRRRRRRRRRRSGRLPVGAPATGGRDSSDGGPGGGAPGGGPPGGAGPGGGPPGGGAPGGGAPGGGAAVPSTTGTGAAPVTTRVSCHGRCPGP